MSFTSLISPLGPTGWPVVFILATGGNAAPEVDPTTGALFPHTVSVQDDEVIDPRAADRKRVLVLADGAMLRDRSRFRDGQWQRREGRDWLPVPGEVVGHTLESDLISRARAMGREVGREDHSARAVLADWMARKGLADEALDELDTILSAAPDHAGALALLRDSDFPLEVLAPGASLADPSQLAIAGAQGSPAVREALIWKLARLRAQFDVLGFITHELTSPQFRRRAFAAHAGRRLARGPLQKALTDRAVLDTMGVVREESALGLRDLEDVQAIAPVVDALGSRFPAVRRNAAESLGNAGYAAAVAPLMSHLAFLRASGTGSSGVRANLYVGFQTAYVGDYDVEIAQAASIADPIVSTQSSGVVFDVRAQAQISRTVTLGVERREVIQALRKLTGKQDLGDEPDEWLAWWEVNREGFLAALNPEPEVKAGAPAEGAPSGGG